MSVKRREFIKGAMALGVSTSLNPFTLSTNWFDYNPEVEEFKKAQRKLLDKYNVSAKSKYLKLIKPPLKVHMLEAGKGSPVVMLHGGGATAALFAPLMAIMKRDYHLFAPDRPGCGLTDGFDYRGVPFREHAVDFVTGIFDSLHLKDASIVANSMGGFWALLFALAKPERVNKLVFIGEVAGSSPPDPSGMHTPHHADPYPPMEQIKGKFAGMLVANINRIAPEILEEDLAASRIPGAALAWNSMLEEIGREQKGLTYALRPQLKDLRPPTLFIWGDKDRFGPPTLGQEMAALAPHARCEIIADAGHLAWLDKLELCSSLTKEFLENKK